MLLQAPEEVSVRGARLSSGRAGNGRRILSVGLVDDHAILAPAVRAAVSQTGGLRFAGIAGTVSDLLASHPGIELVILDLRLADGSSPVSNIRRLVDAGARVLVLTSGENPFLVRAAAGTAISGLVRKSAPLPVLLDTLERVAAGETVMSAEWAAAMDADPELASVRLSDQEQRVLALFARGLKAQVVGYELGISVGTVHDYVRRIRRKYQHAGKPAHTKVDLYKRAVEDGILPPPTA